MALPQQDPGYGQKKELTNLGLGTKSIDGVSGRMPGRPAGRPSTGAAPQPQQQAAQPPAQPALTPEQRQAAINFGSAAKALQDAQAWMSQEPNAPWVQYFHAIAQKAHDYELLQVNHVMPDYNVQE